MSMPSPADALAITQVIHRYCHAIDRADWALVPGCFHADATYRYGPIDGPVETFLAMAREFTAHLDASHHQIGNILMASDGDAVLTEAYFTAYHRVPAHGPSEGVFACIGTPQEVVMAGRYIDRFERRDGVWRIAARRGVHDWWRRAAATDEGLYDTPADWRGARDPSDPATALGHRLLIGDPA
jgi:hypothetical protein